MEAAKVSNAHSISYHGFDEEVRDMSATDILRFARFVQERESQGRLMIEELLSSRHPGEGTNCNHWKDAKDFSFACTWRLLYVS